ncbi:hypothetical protein QUF31_21555 [Dickeya chrysanthemi]|nr:hypothetical protein [Dickeya chrysanthemi]WJM85532.1 hypothetical protein QUF31_21555 [Dickeya chrysanthemi]
MRPTSADLAVLLSRSNARISVIGLGTDRAQRLAQHRIGGRAHRRADRATGHGADHGQQIAGLGIHVHGLVEGLRTQVGQPADGDVGGRAFDADGVGARETIAEAR